jgi:GxxExxY protein
MPGETTREGLALMHGAVTREIIGAFFDDLVVDGKILVETKVAVKILSIHEIQLLNYLKGTGISLGLVLNFGPQATLRRLLLSSPQDGSVIIRQ